MVFTNHHFVPFAFTSQAEHKQLGSIASYTGNKAPYISDRSLNLVLKKLKYFTRDLFRWFKKKQLKANPDISHL